MRDIRPLLDTYCFACHNEQMASGGMVIQPFLAPTSLATARPGWERLLDKIRGGEMPPQGAPQPSDETRKALVKFVDSEFDHADKTNKPDPGRVTARRLNRVEYANTIHDLLGVAFRATEERRPDKPACLFEFYFDES